MKVFGICSICKKRMQIKFEGQTAHKECIKRTERKDSKYKRYKALKLHNGVEVMANVMGLEIAGSKSKGIE